MIQKDFAFRAASILKKDEQVIGLAVAGSWIADELDEFSDLDLILVTKEKISDSKLTMMGYAEKLGPLLSAFTGEHVGEPRLLICLYEDPLLHVDIKFLTLPEFHQRIETPFILLDPTGALKSALNNSTAKFPYPDYQWIEDRFWTWIHYALLKIGRGELMEAYDFFGFLRMVVLGPLVHIKNGNLPRAVRKVETQLMPEDLKQLQATMPSYSKISLMQSLQQSINLYRQLRSDLYPSDIGLQSRTENRVMEFLGEMKSRL